MPLKAQVKFYRKEKRKKKNNVKKKYTVVKKVSWQRWDSNPRPRRDWCLKPAP